MTTNNPVPLEAMWEALRQECCIDPSKTTHYILVGKDEFLSAAAIIAQHYAPLEAEKADLQALVGELGEDLRELEQAEATYRQTHDLFGGGHIKTGRRWDWMRCAGNKARATLNKLEKAQ